MNTKATSDEQLDDLSLHGELLHQTLDSLAWINTWFGNNCSAISKMAKQDGQLSMKRSFSKKECLDIFQKTGINEFRIKQAPLFRLQLSIFPNKRI